MGEGDGWNRSGLDRMGTGVNNNKYLRGETSENGQHATTLQLESAGYFKLPVMRSVGVVSCFSNG